MVSLCLRLIGCHSYVAYEAVTVEEFAPPPILTDTIKAEDRFGSN